MANYNKSYDYDAMFARQSSVITVEIDGQMVTMPMAEYRKRFQPNKGKRSKKRNDADNSVTRIVGVLEGIEKSLKYVKSLQTYNRKGYRMWGTIHNEICAIDNIRTPLNAVSAYYSQVMAKIKELKKMSKANDTDVFQLIDMLGRDIAVINTNISALAAVVSKSGVLDQYSKHEAIRGSKDGRRLGLRRLVRDASRNMMDIDGIIATLREIYESGVDVNEYNLKGKRIG